MDKFSRNGYWVKRDSDNKITGVVKVVNEFDDYNYINGKWTKKEQYVSDIGTNPDWEKVSEKEAFEVLGIL